MNTRFTEIDAEEMKNGFPKFYDPQGRFFELIHKACPIGFVGVRPFGLEDEGNCELSAFVFRQYRNALTKGIVLAALGLPKTLGFKRCWMKTARPGVIKLLNAMGKAESRPPTEGRPLAKSRFPYGVTYVGCRQGKAIFVMELRQTCLKRET
jgi:hypothetical protein